LDVFGRAGDRVPRNVQIAALESARDLLSEPGGEDPDLAARVHLTLAGALPLGRYAEGAELVEASLTLARDTQLRAVAHAFVANRHFHLNVPEKAWPHVTAGLAAAAQLMSSDEPDRGDAVALELLAAVGFSDEPEAAAALLAALGLAAFYDEDRVPAILVALADAFKEGEPELARDCALEGIRRALPDGNERDAARGWYVLAELAEGTGDPRTSTLAAIALDGAERLGREEYTWLPSVWAVEHKMGDPAEQQAARDEVVRGVLDGTYAPGSERYKREVKQRLERRADERPGRIVEEARSHCAELLTDLRERGYG
jgi:hypothetical protein